MDFYQLLPNIWICILRPNANQIEKFVPKVILKQFADQHKITKLIKAHKDLDFFGKSSNYIDIIKTQMERDEIKKLYSYLLNTSKKIFDFYSQGENTLIISGYDMYKSLSIIITFLIKYADMNITQCINSMKTKIPYPINIPNNYNKTLILVEKLDSN